MWRLIIHSLLRRQWQSLATLLGVTLGVGLLWAVLLLYQGLKQGLEVGRQRLGADLLVVPAGATVDVDEALFAGSPLNIYMDKKYADAVRHTPGVRRVEAQFFTQTLQLECCSVGNAIRLVGIEDGVTNRLAKLSPQGRPAIGKDEVILGHGTLGGTGGAGTMVELLGEIFRVAYRLDSTGTGLDDSILLPLETARRLAGQTEALRPVWEKSGAPDQLISALLVEVDDADNIETVAAAVEQLGPLKVIRAAEAFQRVKRMIGAFVVVLAGAGALTAFGGIFYLFGHFTSVAWDRKGEWALYRALGATRWKLVVLVVGESVILSAGGALLGLPLGFILYRLALVHLLAQNAFPFIAPGGEFFVLVSVATVALYTVLGIVAAILPAVRVAQLEPAQIMAQGDID